MKIAIQASQITDREEIKKRLLLTIAAVTAISTTAVPQTCVKRHVNCLIPIGLGPLWVTRTASISNIINQQIATGVANICRVMVSSNSYLIYLILER